MQSIFDKNIQAMKKWYPEFAENLVIKRNELEKKEELISLKSQDDEDIVIVKRGSRILYLYGKRNVKQSIALWRERLGEIHAHAPLLLIGLGNGKYLQNLVETTDESVTIIAYEPSIALFFNMLETVDLSKEIENRPIAFCVEGINEEGLERILSTLITAETIDYFKVEIHPNYNELFPEEIMKVLKLSNKITEFIIVNCASGAFFSKTLVKNQIENLKFMCEGYSVKGLFESLPKNQPAILVSAGPSLNDSIKYLKKAKNKAFILAVDTALKPLIKNGIRPDAFITLDAVKPLSLFDMEEIKDIPVITPLLGNSEVLKEQRNKIIFYYDDYVLGQKVYEAAGKRLYGVTPGGSVACGALSLLYRMGFMNIILVGQDLAFTNNRSHADGTFHEHMPEEKLKDAIWVKGNYVDKIATRADMKMYIDWFESYIEGIHRHSETRVINATEGGAFIEGTELMHLQDVIEEFCTSYNDNEKCIESMISDFNDEERKAAVNYIKSLPIKFSQMNIISKKIEKEYKKIEKYGKTGNLDKKLFSGVLKKINRLTEEIEGYSEYQMVSATMPLAEFVIRNESLIEFDSVEEEAISIGRQGSRFSQMLIQSTEILREFSETVVNDIV